MEVFRGEDEHAYPDLSGVQENLLATFSTIINALRAMSLPCEDYESHPHQP